MRVNFLHQCLQRCAPLQMFDNKVAMWRTQSAGHVGQQAPFVVVGFAIAFVHKVGKHQTLGQKVLAFPPLVPVAPVMAASTLMLGFTQYAQQWPAISVLEKPAGHFRLAAQVIPAHGSAIPFLMKLPSCSWLRSWLARTSLTVCTSFCSCAWKLSWIWKFCCFS